MHTGVPPHTLLALAFLNVDLALLHVLAVLMLLYLTVLVLPCSRGKSRWTENPPCYRGVHDGASGATSNLPGTNRGQRDMHDSGV